MSSTATARQAPGGQRLLSRRGFLLFAAMCVIWGIPYLFIRVAVDELSPAVLVFARTGVAALILLPIALARGGIKPALRLWRPLVIFAAVEIAGPWWLLSSAEQRISSSLAGLLVSAVPVVATVVAPLVGTRERTGPAAWVGLGLGVAGVAAIVGLDIRGASPLALIEMGLVVVGYSLAPAIASRHLSALPGLTVTAFALGLCAVGYAPLALLQLPHSVPSPGVIASVAVLALVCTALAFVLFFALIAEVGPVRSTVITYVNPAVAALLGAVILHEVLTPGMGAGFVLVVVGSALATHRRRLRPEATGQPAPDPAWGRVGPSPRSDL